MKVKYIVLLIFVCSSIVYSQDGIFVKKNQFKINVLLPGFVYEYGFNKKSTLYSELSFGFGYRNSDFGGSSLSVYPNINEQFRYYYNLEKRAQKGKRTDYNSGNFIALNGIYNFKSISNNNNLTSDASSLTIASVWGLQRTYKGNFNLGLNAGFGYNFEKYENEFVPVINFSIGWVIGK